MSADVCETCATRRGFSYAPHRRHNASHSTPRAQRMEKMKDKKTNKKTNPELLTLTAENIDDVYEAVSKELLDVRKQCQRLEAIKKECVAVIEKEGKTERWHLAGYTEMVFLRRQNDIIKMLKENDLFSEEFTTTARVPRIKRNEESEA